MKIWKFAASGLLRGFSVALSMVLVSGILAIQSETARASLIGDNIIVSTTAAIVCDPTPCVDGDGTAGGGLLVVDNVANPELQTGDGSGFASFFSGLEFGSTGVFFPSGSIDIQDSSILLTFTFGAGAPGFQGSFTFSSLDWVNDPTATIVSVTCATDCLGFNNGGPLASDLTLNPIDPLNPNQFTVLVDCAITGGAPCLGGNPGTLSILLDITPTAHGDDNGNGIPVPEPATFTLFGVGLGMLGLMVMMRRRRSMQMKAA